MGLARRYLPSIAVMKLAAKCEAALWRECARQHLGDYRGANSERADAEHFAVLAFRRMRSYVETGK